MIKKDESKVIEAITVLKGLKLAILLSLLISAILIIWTIDIDSFTRAIESISPAMILFLILTMGLNWVVAGLILKILVNTVGEKISLGDSIIIFLSGAFISNVTPFATGGGPFQIYFLHKKGINIGKASMVIVTQLVLRLFYFTITSSIAMIFFKDYISPGVIPVSIFYLAVGAGFLFGLFVIMFTVVPGTIDWFVGLIFSIKRLRSFVQGNHRAKRLMVKVRTELREFRKSLNTLGKYPFRLFLAGLCTAIYWSTLFMVIPLILNGLGLEAHYLKSYVMQTIYYLVIPYMPTPGASGIAELGFASLFVSFIPGSLVGLVTFIWRFITFYLILFIGGCFAFKEIGWKRG